MLRTVTWDPAPVHGEADIKITLGSIKINHRRMVADIEDDFILGMDALKQHGFTSTLQSNGKYSNGPKIFKNFY